MFAMPPCTSHLFLGAKAATARFDLRNEYLAYCVLYRVLCTVIPYILYRDAVYFVPGYSLVCTMIISVQVIGW
jgi:hypothetical protein